MNDTPQIADTFANFRNYCLATDRYPGIAPPLEVDYGSVRSNGYSITAKTEVFRRVCDTGMEWAPFSRMLAPLQLNSTSTLLADVPGLATTVDAGRTYWFRAVLDVDPSESGGHRYAIGGTATATAVRYQVQAWDAATGAVIPLKSARQTHLGGIVDDDDFCRGQSTGLPLQAKRPRCSTVAHVVIEGYIRVETAGTLAVQFAQNATGGTSTVLTGSLFEVRGVGTY
jgi:hypothetical protein